MGQFNLTIQLPKPTKPVKGVLYMDRKSTAQFFTGEGKADSHIVGEMQRIRIEHASSQGILISGVERIGDKVRLQEWWLAYAVNKEIL